MPNPPVNPLDRPIVVQTSETVLPKTTTVPVLVEDNSNRNAWIAGLAVLGLALLVGLIWSSNHKDRPERTDVTVNNTELTSKATPDTTIIETDRVVTSQPEDVQVFVTTSERTIERLSRPDDAANQAEVEAIRARMEDLRQADQEQAQVIRQELEASLARLEAQAANSSSTTTTVSTNGEDTVVTNQTSGGDMASAAQNQASLDQLETRVEDASTQLSQLESTAAPQAAAEVTRLNEKLATLRTKLSQATTATGTQQATLISQVESELAALESAVTKVPVQ